MTLPDNAPAASSNGQASDPNAPVDVICGPLINFKNMDVTPSSSVWRGSILIVTKPSQSKPQLRLRQAGPVTNDMATNGALASPSAVAIDGVRLYEDPLKAFWRFSISVTLEPYEARWEYTIPGFRYAEGGEIPGSWDFAVPSGSQSMRLMFHSCNGFSVGTDMDAWVGPNLWNDVLRVHAQKPFHAMIGGGDQLYNDGIRVDGPLKEWTAISNPHKRRAHGFDNNLRARCDEYYYANYVRWYSTEPFKAANGRIPQINVWDDHDIIDGFGSYTDHFMRCSVFRGIGGVAFKYYCLFQHHIAPPKSTYTTDAPQTMHAINGTAGADPRQLENTFVLEETTEDDSWIIGKRPGPYVEEKSRNLYMRLGKRFAFIGVDARTERTRHQVNYPDTYDLIFSRLENEVAAANGDIKHLVVLLGVPIAYPRLAWLENILSSPLIAPIRLLNKRFGFAGGLFNQFDGQVDLLDDLDDHYTARQHKKERRIFIQRLQGFSKAHSVRVTILGGDVHLAAIGRFYSNPSLRIHSEHDPRYMVNVVSSAITNKPPPKAVANLLARRNKLHHMDPSTDETLMSFFDRQPGGQEKSASWNKVTMPSRNYACITEIGGAVPQGENGEAAIFPLPADGHAPLHQGEADAGSAHPAADGFSSSSAMPGGLDVTVRVEINPQDRDGATDGYAFSIPALAYVPSEADSRPQSRTRSLRPRSLRPRSSQDARPRSAVN
ncbi:hypothetical protein BO70DRAFT_39850 [Aspergillus heteromorphus CBS 117.55]|uniref:PhoD-like phosphatase domain-containing protein n=1 Tax=Aspergillus heteromorphus CBS 117.55 TaxID=1448321 RepID=A0A317W6W2_9EURO|nr:uncharacterized protein BO70DRAFT_39850 [Aspergillus heteromorphus CBS 117.55]PWY81799.1 hypothetical protein BO70DRAFT_39850 [Aspergillus heteromorphus CBS 117.55]